MPYAIHCRGIGDDDRPILQMVVAHCDPLLFSRFWPAVPEMALAEAVERKVTSCHLFHYCFHASGLRCLKWQADVAACGPIRCRHEYGLAGIGVPMVPILLMLAAVFSSSHSAGSVV